MPSYFADNQYSSRNMGLLGAALAFFYFWFSSYLYLYQFSLGGPKPLYSYFAFIAFTTLVFSLKGLPTRPVDLRSRGNLKKLFAWVIAYSMYCSLQAMRDLGSEFALGQYIQTMQLVALTVCSVFLLMNLRFLRYASGVFLVVVLVSVVINLWDFFDPRFSKVPGRAAGLYVNPTISGVVIALSMVPALLAVAPRYRLWLAFFSGFGALLTFSRGSWIIWMVGVLACWFYGVLPFRASKQVKVVLLAFVSIGLFAFVFSGMLGQLLAESFMGQYLDDNTLQRLGVGSDSLGGYSAEERESMVWISLSSWYNSPLFGHGYEVTSPSSGAVPAPHNMFLLFMVEGGVIGLSIFGALVLLLFNSRSEVSRIFALQFTVSCLFSHNNLQQPAFAMLIAFAVVYSAGATATASRHNITCKS